MKGGGDKSHRPLRVAQFCGAIDGARWMVDISAGLQERGYDVVAMIASAEGGTARDLNAVGVPFIVVPHSLRTQSPIVWRLGRIPLVGPKIRDALDVLAMLASCARIARMLRRMKIDVMHTHVFPSILVGRIAAFMARVPIRVSQITGPYHLESPPFRRADVATHWMDHRLLAGSGAVDRIYEQIGISARRRRVVAYGVDPNTFDPEAANGSRFRRELGIDEEAPLIGQVAFFYGIYDRPTTPPLLRGLGFKGQQDFVQAAQIVLEKRPDARFVLVGDGWGPPGEEEMRAVQQQVRDLELEDAVIFTGRRSDVPDILVALDVSVQCSLSDNYGGTIESLLMRTPTIATRVGGLPETVRHEETGLLVPPRDPEALAAAMLRLIEDRELAARLGRAGRELMLAGWTIQGTTAGVARAYEEVARERSVVTW